ncbi:PfkB family carbohydrate kinase [Rhizobium wenxiniae]
METSGETSLSVIATIVVKLVSTHGAGDEFIGVLAAELLRGVGSRRRLVRQTRPRQLW